MPEDKGTERRRLIHLRKAINETPSRERRVLTGMARRLGVDRLEEIDPEPGKKTTYQKMVCSLEDLEEKAKKSPHYWKRAEGLPSHIKTMRLGSFMLSGETLRALEQAGIMFVEDFVMKSESTLLEIHELKKDVIEETRNLLYGYGIRTVDNPPKPGEGPDFQAH